MSALLNILDSTFPQQVFTVSGVTPIQDISRCETVAVQLKCAVSGTPDFSLQLQHSIDGVNFYPLGSAIAVTGAGNYVLGNVDPVGRYFQIAVTVTTGTLTLNVSFLGKGIS